MDKMQNMRSEMFRMLPMGQYEFVDVTFAAADTDTVVPYSILHPQDFESIRWIDVTPQSGKVYRASDPNKTAWGNGYIILRNTAAQTTRLLLFVERD